jgi:hypothetical protein
MHSGFTNHTFYFILVQLWEVKTGETASAQIPTEAAKFNRRLAVKEPAGYRKPVPIDFFRRMTQGGGHEHGDCPRHVQIPARADSVIPDEWPASSLATFMIRVPRTA